MREEESVCRVFIHIPHPRVPSEEDDKLLNFLVAGGHGGNRERTVSSGNIGE